MDATGFHRLSQSFEDVAGEFGGFVHEQHPTVSATENTDRSGATSADERRGGAAVVRRLERRPVIESLAAVEFPTQGPNCGDLHGFVVPKWRQDSRETLGQQGLTGSGCAAHEQVVPAGGRDLETEPSFGLSLDFGEVVEFRGDGDGTVHFEDCGQCGYGHRAPVGVDNFSQRGDREDSCPSDEPCLIGIADGDDETVETSLQRGVEGRKHSGHGADPAVESDLTAVDDVAGVIVGDQRQCFEHGDGDAEVESGADLRHCSWREVDGQVLCGDGFPEVSQGRPKSLA